MLVMALVTDELTDIVQESGGMKDQTIPPPQLMEDLALVEKSKRKTSNLFGVRLVETVLSPQRGGR